MRFMNVSFLHVKDASIRVRTGATQMNIDHSRWQPGRRCASARRCGPYNGQSPSGAWLTSVPNSLGVGMPRRRIWSEAPRTTFAGTPHLAEELPASYPVPSGSTTHAEPSTSSERAERDCFGCSVGWQSCGPSTSYGGATDPGEGTKVCARPMAMIGHPL
jgi:hypothetical protein